MRLLALALVALALVASPRTYAQTVDASYPEPILAGPSAPSDSTFYLDPGFAVTSSTGGVDQKTLAGLYPSRPVISFVDDRGYAVTPTGFFLQVSTEGRGGEGHAVINFVRSSPSGFVIDGSFGLYSNNAEGRWAPSFDLGRTFDPSADGCADEYCSVPKSPTPEAVAAFRLGYHGYFGPLPRLLAARILKESGRGVFLRIDEVSYLARLNKLRGRLANVNLLTAAYVRGSFRADWQALGDIVCLNQFPRACDAKGPGDELWPQAWFSSLLADRGRLNKEYSFETLTASTRPHSVERLRVKTGDKVNGKPGLVEFSGEAFVCFTFGRKVYWSGLNDPLLAQAFRGTLVHGVPHGPGTVYMSNCDEARYKPNEAHRIQTTFENGVPEGAVSAYNALGRLVLFGQAKQALLQDRAKIIGDYGTEVSDAGYKDGMVTDGPVTFSVLDFFFTKFVPPPRSEVFIGIVSGDQLKGTWSPLAMIIGDEGDRYGYYNGRLILDLRDGQLVTAFARRDYGSLSYRFTGDAEYTWPSGDRLLGKYNREGTGIVGSARYWRESAGKWYDTTVDEDGKFVWTKRKVTSYAWYDNVFRELGRWGDKAIDQIDRAGHGFEHFMCRLTGTEEGRNCSVGVGASADSQGNVVLTDGSGAPSEKPEPAGPVDWAARLDWAHAADFADIDRDEENFGLEPSYITIDENIVGRAPANVQKDFRLEVGVPTETGKLREPLGGNPYFGARRADVIKDVNGNPVTVYRAHLGTDYAAAPGDPIFSPVDGIATVVRADESTPKRNYIQITTPSGVKVGFTYVQPLEGPLPLKPNMRVTRGSLLGSAMDLGRFYNGVPNHVHVQYWVPNASGDGKGYWVSPDGSTAMGRANIPCPQPCRAP